MVKDRYIMERWARQAYRTASNRGMRRHIALDKFVDYWMSDYCAVTTLPEDKTIVQRQMITIFLELETLCTRIEQGDFKASTVRLATDVVQW